MTRSLVVFALGVTLLVSPARELWMRTDSAFVAFAVWAVVLALGWWSVRPKERQ